MEYLKIKITAAKIETINGKKMGRSYSFIADMKEYSKCKTMAALTKKVREAILEGKVFKPSEMDELKYSGMQDLLAEWKKVRPAAEALETHGVKGRETPENITHLAPNEVFVFGSNASGMHYGGAARYALEHFGAVMGQGRGMQGMSYAIDSMSGLYTLKEEVIAFAEYAAKHPEKKFLVTPIGCGIAGQDASDVAPLFACCRELENVLLPRMFWKELEKSKE